MYNVVVVVNGGKRPIPRKLLEELAIAAGAETWECIDLPEESRITSPELTTPDKADEEE